MKKVLILLLFSLFTLNSANMSAQNDPHKKVKAMLDVYCSNYFYDCFGWRYIKIVGVDKVEVLKDRRIKIKGTVQNTGYFGSIHNRAFIATLTYLDNDRMNISFLKHGVAYGVESWKDCNNTIDLE